MKSISLEEAAIFLDMNAEVLRRKAKSGIIPGNKPGKKWRFIEEHLADWISGRYPETGRELRVIDGGKLKTEENQCPSNHAVKTKFTGYTSLHQLESEYDKQLGQPTGGKRKNCTTKSKRNYGG